MRKNILRLSLTKAPQPAKTFIWCFVSVFLVVFVVAAITGSTWVFSAGAVVVGTSFFLFGYCFFRDVNAAATTASRLYKESRGLGPERFTFFDVPTLRALGFAQMTIGVLFVVAAVMELVQQ